VHDAAGSQVTPHVPPLHEKSQVDPPLHATLEQEPPPQLKEQIAPVSQISLLHPEPVQSNVHVEPEPHVTLLHWPLHVMSHVALVQVTGPMVEVVD
jgi:hypothetical protein